MCRWNMSNEIRHERFQWKKGEATVDSSQATGKPLAVFNGKTFEISPSAPAGSITEEVTEEDTQ